MIGFFVSGTDTSVGKTRISLGLITLLQQQGQTVAAMKPVASGCVMTETGLHNEDALLLQAQSSVSQPYELINPYAFEAAIAPHIAAEREGVEIDITTIKIHFDQIQQCADSVVVEGAGGWLVPINNEQTMADLAKALNLPVVLVVNIRLGCINHALLTVAAIQQSGLSLYGWVANQIEPVKEAEAIVETLKSKISEKCIGIIPPLLPEQTAATYLNLE